MILRSMSPWTNAMLSRREALKQMFAGTIGILPALKIVAGVAVTAPVLSLKPGMTFVPLSAITCDPSKSFRADVFGNLGPLTESIRDVGLMNPIDVNPQGEVVNGFRRFKALQELGIKTIPVRVYSDREGKLAAAGIMSNRSICVSSYGDEEDELEDDEIEESDDALDDDEDEDEDDFDDDEDDDFDDEDDDEE